MSKLRWILIAIIVILILSVVAWLVSTRLLATASMMNTASVPTPLAAFAKPSPTPLPTAAVPGSLVTNPSFEGKFITWGPANNVAAGWRSWYLPEPPCKPWKPDCWIPCPSNCIVGGVCVKDYGCLWQQPEFAEISYDPYTYRIHTGAKAQKWFSFSRMHQGGLYQQVTGVKPGALLEFTAWMQAWMCYDPNKTGACQDGRVSNYPGEIHLKIGIDPTGGTVPTSTQIVWSEEQNVFDKWISFTVRAVALNNTVTVFTHARPAWDWARINNDVYLDDANLVIVTPPLLARFSSIQPAQPELGQTTQVNVTADQSLSNAAMTITDPSPASVTLTQSTLAGNGPFTWTWLLTPTIPGVYTLAFSADTLAAPITTTLYAIAAAHIAAQPATAWLSQTVNVQVSAYRIYYRSDLTVTDPTGNAIIPSYDGITNEAGRYTRSWSFASTTPGQHLVAYTANLIETPVTASVTIVSMLGADAFPPAPPLDKPVTIQAWAYYPYDLSLELTGPGGTVSPIYLGRADGTPLVWRWVFTPAIAGTYTYTLTAPVLDAPASGVIFAGGYAVYLPVVLVRPGFHARQ